MHVGSLPDQGGTPHFTGLPPNKADRGTWLDAIWLWLEKPEVGPAVVYQQQRHQLTTDPGALLDWIRQRFHNEAGESSLNMPRVTAGTVGVMAGPGSRRGHGEVMERSLGELHRTGLRHMPDLMMVMDDGKHRALQRRARWTIVAPHRIRVHRRVRSSDGTWL
ncbi:hypothetical protein CH63R_06621 [Colletotrichum higginsianum IMI 349063]|uniref:Uncharacterized protein n=1 Tax=Colletotrichum higginsianum (strain IMI 349063) TaxID=759273 RepID=A0A1B7YFT5_COLHI|nr:hypothetical protein CH63R_06621 [Colletotrichum higginsianum IMI 349063]OBR10929.1 hypothetical protein CH63R_06621 [Colletotrichum higginsianum IMI 349063]